MGRGVLWGLIVALGMPAVAWGCTPITDPRVIPILDIGLPREIPMSGSLLLADGDLGWLGRLMAPDGAEVTWDQELVPGEPRRVRPVDGWQIGEYEVLDFDGEPLGPAYRVVDVEDEEPPAFEVTGWSGRSPGRFPAFDTCGGYAQDRAVRVEHDGPDEPVFWLWETHEDGEVLEAGSLRGTVEIPAPARAVDIHLTALDTSGNRTTQVIEGAVGCTGCTGSQGPTAPAALGLLVACLALLGRRRPAA